MADDTIQTTLRLSPDLHEYLRQTAFDKKISINAEIIHRLIGHEDMIQTIKDLIKKLDKHE